MILPDTEVRAYFRELQHESQLLNANRDLCEIDFSYYFDYPKQLPNYLVEKITRKGSRVYKETLATVHAVLDMFLEGKHVALIGLIQSDKSLSQMLGGVFGSMVRYLATRKYVHPVFFTPNTKGTYYGQFEAKFQEMIHCLEHVRIKWLPTGESVSVLDYNNELQHRRNEQMGNVMGLLNRERTYTKKDWNDLLKQKAEVQNKKYLMFPMSIKYEEILNILFATFQTLGDGTIIDRDEAHFAIGEDSVNDKIYGDKDNPRKVKIADILNAEHGIADPLDEETRLVETSIYNIVNRHKPDALFMAVSATNWAALHLDIAVVRLNENYCGLDFGFQLADGTWTTVTKSQGVQIKQPEIFSMEEVASLIGNQDFAYVVPSCYESAAGYSKACKRDYEFDERFNSWEEYKKRCVRAIADAIQYYLVDVNPLNHKGMLIRFVNSNEVMDDFVRHLERLLDKHGIRIIKEYGSHHRTIEELLGHYNLKPDDRYVILPTAGCRMSDSFPISCGYGIDLTAVASTWAALLQGVLGRMSGYFKHPLVVLSEANKKMVEDYIENGYVPPSGQLLPTAYVPRGRSLICFRSEDSDIIRAVCERTEKLITSKREGTTRWYNGRPKLVLSLGANVSHNFWEECLGQEGLEHCQGLLKHRRLLLPGEVDETGRSYQQGKHGPVLTVRQEGKDWHAHRGGQDGAVEGRGVRIIIRVRQRYNQFKVVGFDLALFRTHKGGVEVMQSSVTGKIKGDKSNEDGGHKLQRGQESGSAENGISYRQAL